jgi:preprotein translocase subunit SecD
MRVKTILIAFIVLLVLSGCTGKKEVTEKNPIINNEEQSESEQESAPVTQESALVTQGPASSILEFRDEDGNVCITNDDIMEVYYHPDSNGNVDEHSIHNIKIEFTEQGTSKFSEVTTKNIGKTLGIYINDELISAPTVQIAITDGIVILSGGFTKEQAQDIVSLLNK